MMSNKIVTAGKRGEIFAREFLKNKGFEFLCSNYHSRYGEIDIIMQNDKYIIFVEVKTRRAGSMVRGLESVSKNKREKLTKTAYVYLLNNPSEKQPRFDVVEIIKDYKMKTVKINHLENAFDAEEFDAFF